MIKILILNGPPRSGKDTAFKGIKEAYDDKIERIKFATPVKEACHVLLGNEYGEDEFEDEKDTPSPYFFNVSPRKFYIELAEHVKKVFTQEFFGYVFLRRYRWKGYEQRDSILIVSDCGFNEELEPLKRFFDPTELCLVRIHREGKDYSKDSRGYIRNAVDKEYDVFNVEGNPGKMIAEIISIISKENFYEQYKI